MRRNRLNRSQSALVADFLSDRSEDTSIFDVMTQRHQSNKDKRARKIARDKQEREEF